MATTAPQYFQQVRLDDGAPAAFARLYSYLSESSTPKSIYFDEDLTSPCPQPLLADAGGNFPQYFLGTGAYRFVVQDRTEPRWRPVTGSHPRERHRQPSTTTNSAGSKADSPEIITT